MKRIKLVLIGGGTGLSVLARGLKDFPIDITTIVTVSDDGGSTGKIIKERYMNQQLKDCFNIVLKKIKLKVIL